MRYEQGATAKIIDNTSQHCYPNQEVVTILSCRPLCLEVTNGTDKQWVNINDLLSMEISENDSYYISRIEDYVAGQFGFDVSVMREARTNENKDFQELVHYAILQHTDLDTKALSMYYNIDPVTFYSLVVSGDSLDVYRNAVKHLEL